MFMVKILTIMILIVFVIIMFGIGVELAHTLNTQYIKKLNDKIEFLKDCREEDAKQFKSVLEEAIYLNLKNNELKKKNDELRKELDKQSNVTYNYYINKDN